MSNNKKIDFVLLYVNPKDSLWLKSAEKHGVFEQTISNGRMRFDDDNTIELAVDSIRKYCDFANDIYLVVCAKRQVPKSLLNKVKIITHRDFIPRKYLPTFSALCIECFLPFLPNVSNEFIFMNDDMIFTSPVKYEDFFCDDIPLANISVGNVIKRGFMFHQNCYEIIMGKHANSHAIHSQHGPTPFNKSLLMNCYKKYEKEILDSITPLRRSANNIGQYFYSFYLFCNHYVGNIRLNHKTLFGINDYIKFEWNDIGKYQSICVNSPTYGDISRYVDKIKKHIYES